MEKTSRLTQLKEDRSLPLRLLPILCLDFVGTLLCYGLGSLYSGNIVGYFLVSLDGYMYYNSVLDLTLLSLPRPIVLGVAAWKLRSPRGSGSGLKFCCYCALIICCQVLLYEKTEVFSVAPGLVALGKLGVLLLADVNGIWGGTSLSKVNPSVFVALGFCGLFSFLAVLFTIIINRRNAWVVAHGYVNLNVNGTRIELTDDVASANEWGEYDEDLRYETLDIDKVEGLKEGEKHATMLRVVKLAIPEIPMIVVGLGALFVSSASNLTMPYFFGQVVAVISNANGHEEVVQARAELLHIIVLLLIIFGIGGVFTWVRGWLFTLAGQSLVTRVRKLVFNIIMLQDIDFFDVTRTGELTNRLSSDTQVLQNSLTTNISMAVRNFAEAIGAIVLLFIISWRLTLVMMASVPVVVIVAVVYGRSVMNLRQQLQDKLAESTSVAEEAISAMRTIRSFAHEKKTQMDYGKKVDLSYEEGKKLSLAYGLFVGALGIFAQAAICLVVWYGGTLVLEKQLTTGTLLSFLLYTLTVAFNVATLSSLVGDIAQAVGAAERIFELIDRIPKIPIEGGLQMVAVQGDVRIQNVTFTYKSRPESPILKGLSLHLQQGKVVALVGPSGGGKSTIVALIERFYDPDLGLITLDGKDIKTLDPIWYRQQIGYVSQEPVLFAASIRDNITFGPFRITLHPVELGVERVVTEEEIIHAATQANAHDFISKFEKGYDQMVGERGVMLSGGQKQRVAIARALIKNPKILLLDEATSALDSESEHLVQQAIDRAMVDRTVLVIAHRLSTVRNAHKVCVVQGGDIVEEGVHEELIRKGGLYKQLVKRQLQAPPDAKEDLQLLDE